MAAQPQAITRGFHRVGEAGHEVAQFPVGRQEAHIGGAFEEVAHHDVDHVARLGADLGQHVAHLFVGETADQFPLQA